MVRSLLSIMLYQSCEPAPRTWIYIILQMSRAGHTISNRSMRSDSLQATIQWKQFEWTAPARITFWEVNIRFTYFICLWMYGLQSGFAPMKSLIMQWLKAREEYACEAHFRIWRSAKLQGIYQSCGVERVVPCHDHYSSRLGDFEVVMLFNHLLDI